MLKRKRSLVAALFLFILCSSLAALSSPAAATTVAEKRAQARAIMGQLETLNTQMEMVIEQYNAAAGELATVNDKISDNERNLTIARYNLLVANDTLESRAVAMYKQQPVDVLDVVLATNSFDELITRLDMLNRLGQSDVGVVDSIEKYQRDIKRAATALAADRVAAERLLAERAARKSEVEQSLAQRQSLLKGVEDEIAALQRAQEQQLNRQAVKDGAQTTGGTAPPGSPQVVAIAYSKAGCPYEYGAAGPNSFDCSGFTMWCYAQIGISLPHNAAAQQAMCTPIGADQLMAGDLVFFGAPAHHVGIFVSGGTMIHAPQTGQVVGPGSIAGASGYGRP